MLNFDNADLVPHIIYCYGDGYYHYDDELEKFIMSRMKKYGLQSTIFTTLFMGRQNLITKEKSKAAYEGKLKNERDWKDYEGSINDDLESFIDNLQEISSLEEVKKQEVWSFFLPKLTKEELKLVEEKNSDERYKHMMTYSATFSDYRKDNADVDEDEMKKSDSKDKYVHGRCYRWTKVLNLDQTSSESTITNESESAIQTQAEVEKVQLL